MARPGLRPHGLDLRVPDRDHRLQRARRRLRVAQHQGRLRLHRL